MPNFKDELKDKLIRSTYNYYGIENYDEGRFGPYLAADELHWVKQLYLKCRYYLQLFVPIGFLNLKIQLPSWLEVYASRLEALYGHLTDRDKHLLVELIAYRIVGNRKVKLSRNNKRYYDAIALGVSMENDGDTIDPGFMHFKLKHLDLNAIGLTTQLYFSGQGIAVDFILEQYAYKHLKDIIIEAKLGDVVIDAGGCWGDTALYFAGKTGTTGKVYTFEFIPNNIQLFNKNIALNPNLAAHIQLIPHPLAEVSDKTIYFQDKGPSSEVKLEPFAEQTGSTTTVTIDDFVERYHIEKIDFIKMDIEGSEQGALTGAIKTIKRFRPTLAIANYHSIDDLINIPLWIINLGLDYDIYMDHFTIHAEETVCFAIPKNKKTTLTT